MIANGQADVLGHFLDRPEELVDVLGFEIGVPLERGVQPVDVRLVMLVVMQLHRLLIDEGFEGV